LQYNLTASRDLPAAAMELAHSHAFRIPFGGTDRPETVPTRRLPRDNPAMQQADELLDHCS